MRDDSSLALLSDSCRQGYGCVFSLPLRHGAEEIKEALRGRNSYIENYKMMLVKEDDSYEK